MVAQGEQPTGGLRVHQRALALVEKLLDQQAYYRVRAHSVAGATVIDCGIHTLGGQEAGCLYSEISLGALGQVRLSWLPLEEELWPVAEVYTDHPALACLACQHTDWFIQKGNFSAPACGPARLLTREHNQYSPSEEVERSDYAVLCCESRDLPSEEVVDWVARHCRVKRQNVFLLVTPTASIVAAVQMASRSVETGLYKMLTAGYDVEKVACAKGLCFVPPASGDDQQALGRTNDAIIYGSVANYDIDDATANLREVLDQIPSSQAADYGQLFGKLFQRYGNFFNIDPALFGPSQVCLTSVQSGENLRAGQLRPDLLRASFG